jgi:hypothetical protein
MKQFLLSMECQIQAATALGPSDVVTFPGGTGQLWRTLTSVRMGIYREQRSEGGRLQGTQQGAMEGGDRH